MTQSKEISAMLGQLRTWFLKETKAEWHAFRSGIETRYRAYLQVLIASLASLIVGGLIGYLALGKTEIFFIISSGTVIVCLLLSQAYAWRNKQYARLENILLQTLADELGLQYDPAPKQFFLDHFREFSLTPGLAHEELSDRIEIETGSLRFSFAKLYAYRQIDWRIKLPAFRGILIKLMLDQEVQGKVLINSRRFSNQKPPKSKAGLKNIQIGNAEIDKSFDIFASDYATAYSVMQPRFLEQLEQLKSLFNCDDLQAVYAHGSALIAIETYDCPLVSKALAKEGKAEDLFDKFAADLEKLIRLVELLKP